jgi:hypothetical protein
MNKGADQQVAVGESLFILPQVAQRDGEIEGLRTVKLDPARRPQGGNALLVVPAKFTLQAADGKDRIARFSPATVRLVAGGKNYFPVGTLDSAGVLVVNRPDDFLFADLNVGDANVAFVFELPAEQVVQGKTVADGVFFEAKRLARVDLSGKPVQERGSLAVPDGVLRKPTKGATPGAPAVAPTPQQPVATPAPPAGRDVMPVP